MGEKVFLEFVFHSTTDPLSLNFQTMNNSKVLFHSTTVRHNHRFR